MRHNDQLRPDIAATALGRVSKKVSNWAEPKFPKLPLTATICAYRRTSCFALSKSACSSELLRGFWAEAPCKDASSSTNFSSFVCRRSSLASAPAAKNIPNSSVRPCVACDVLPIHANYTVEI
eukprot:1183188-Prorocentrum_minimum.AAC.1